MLRTALESVASQTAIDEILEVIVSENMSDPGSEAVCAGFPMLPIAYRMRRPPVPVANHLSLVLAEARGTVTALLHDDDWWSPDFLSLRNLDLNPSASLSLGAVYLTAGERHAPQAHDSKQFWFGAGCPEWRGTWLLDRTSVALGTLMATAGHYSTVVAPTEIFRKIMQAVDATGNTYDTDRMFFFEATKYGPVVFDPIPKAFVRLHPANDNKRYSKQEVAVQLEATSEWILNQCAQEGIDIAKELADRVRALPPDRRMEVAYAVWPGNRDVLRARGLLPADLIPPPLARLWRRLATRVARKIRMSLGNVRNSS
jgi:hypothetical protein